jgi:hypothetical protein
MNYPTFNFAVFASLTSLALATTAQANQPQGFWCGTLDREHEVTVSLPAVMSPNLAAQAAFELTDTSEAAVLARQDGAQAILTDTGITYQAAGIWSLLNREDFIGPIRIDQVSAFQVSININSSTPLTENTPLSGILTITQVNGSQSQMALSCVPLE